MRRFRWLDADPIPFGFDLRRFGWTLIEPRAGTAKNCPALITDTSTAETLGTLDARATAILLGIEDSAERGRLIANGFGDALSARISLPELEARALRLRMAIETVPRERRYGPLVLDILIRDGLIEGRRLGLHPREFSLLWRLAQTPGQPVTPKDLLAEVWRMSFRPETNSLAVHVCRLRAKLAAAGLGGIVSTTPDGCYALVLDKPLDPMLARRIAADLAKPAEPLQTGTSEVHWNSFHET